MPDALREKAVAFRRYASFLGDALILGLVYLLTRRESLPLARLGLHLANWQRDATIGLVAGLLLVLIQGVVLAATPTGADESHW